MYNMHEFVKDVLDDLVIMLVNIQLMYCFWVASHLPWRSNRLHRGMAS